MTSKNDFFHVRTLFHRVSVKTVLFFQVNPGSKAAHGGVREGDLISSINGQNTADMTNSEAHAQLKSSSTMLYLGLNQ